MTTRAADVGDRVRLTYRDGSFVQGVLREVLELEDGTLHMHTRGQVRRDLLCSEVSTDGYPCELLAGHSGFHEERTQHPRGAARHWGQQS